MLLNEKFCQIYKLQSITASRHSTNATIISDDPQLRRTLANRMCYLHCEPIHLCHALLLRSGGCTRYTRHSTFELHPFVVDHQHAQAGKHSSPHTAIPHAQARFHPIFKSQTWISP